MTGSNTQAGAGAVRKPRRGRGRPSAADPSGEQLRDLIIDAASQVYASHGYHGSTVEHILRIAGVSRPTFYRYFKGRREVLDEVIGRVNNVLTGIVTPKAMQAVNLKEVVDTAIDAYFEWGERSGPLLRPIYQEIHDPESPASAHRQRILAELTALFRSRVESLGRPQLDDMMYDTLLHVIEHVGHQAFWPQRESAPRMAARRRVIERIVMASLALPEEAAQLVPLEAL